MKLTSDLLDNSQKQMLLKIFDGIPHKGQRARIILEFMPFCVHLAQDPVRLPMMVEMLLDLLDCEKEGIEILANRVSP